MNAVIRYFFGNTTQKEVHDPVFTFFFKTGPAQRKRVYISALEKAQKDQERFLAATR